MYDHTLHRGKKHFCRYCLKAFNTEEISKRHTKDCCKIYGKQRITMPKKSKNVKLKNNERKIKLPFTFYAFFQSILVPHDNGKQNTEESYTSKYQKHIVCTCGFKLVCVDDKFGELFKAYLCEDAGYNFINSIIKVNKYCSDVIKKIHKELVMTKEDDEDFKNSTKYRICNKVMLIMMLN